MCGIVFSVHRVGEVENDNIDSTSFADLSQKLQAANSTRGPDAQNAHRAFLDCADGATDPKMPAENDRRILALEFFASELRLRGDTPVVQPHEMDGDVLCWNGEIFEGMNISAQENDGVKLFTKLHSMETLDQLPGLFGTIEGPYAFVFYHSVSRRLFFARDPLGRRSLLIHKPTPSLPYLLVASVSAGIDIKYNFEEVHTDHIYCLDLVSFGNERTLETGFSSHLILLCRSPSNAIPASIPFAEPCKVNSTLPPEGLPQVESLNKIPDFLAETVDDLICHLDRSVMLRVQDVPHASVAKGLARVAVLFSGGIDSTVLTYFAHKHIPINEPIDLLNVAFENPRKIKLQAGNPGGLPKRQKKAWSQRSDSTQLPAGPSYLVPDRVTGLQEVEELRQLCPGRVWNFVEVNVPYQESQASRLAIESLILPGRTVMDMSLALALYFASRGVGQIRSSPDAEPKPYTSFARVLLNGLGSDELLGGYGRHRSAYDTGGWQSVIEELQLEIERIPIRNLGRDDRVISSHGKETRHPFLSLAVVTFLARLPVHFKMDPRLEVGLGDKMLLRLAARKLGLIEASGRKKRAMQFGSHSARMDGERRGDTLLD